MRKFTTLILTVLIFTIVLITGCNEQIPPKHKDKVLVYTSIYPVYDFTRQVGGDKIELKNIVPPGGEPHHWEPSPQDIAEMSKADLLIFCGAGMEPWTEKVLDVIDKSKVTVVDTSQNIELINHSEAGNGHEKDNQNHTSMDPHIWLDPVNAKVMVENILVGLVKVDVKNKSYYEKNAVNYKKELDQLHNEYQIGLANTKIKDFVTSHAAFSYLAKRYGLNQVPIRGLSPEVEPSPADMAEIIELAREKNIKYIFFETLVSPKVSKTIASELKAETLVLNPVGGLTEEEIAAGHGYLYVMRENLKNLKKALGVKLATY